VMIFILLIQSFSMAGLAKDNNKPLIWEESAAELVYTGDWVQLNGGYNKGKAKFTKDGNASVTFRFTGNGFKYIGTKSSTNLPIHIYIDGQLAKTINPHNRNTMNKQTLFEIADL